MFENGAWVNLSSSAGIWLQNTTDVYLFDITKNVGIGTSAPQFKLDIRGEDVDDPGVLSISNSDQSHYLRLYSSSNIYQDASLSWKEGDDLSFGTDQNGWTEKMRITSAGKVGIGTSTPEAYTKFHVVATGSPLPDQLLGTVACFQTNAGTSYTSRVSIIGGNVGLSIIDFGDADNQQSGKITYGHTDNFMSFHTNDTEKMRIESGGNVGIGTTTPDQSAILDLTNTDKGFLPPKMNSLQRDAIASPSAGLMIYNIDENKMQMFNGTIWKNLEISPCTIIPDQPGTISGNNVVSENATGEVYSISAVSDASSYLWSVPPDATIVSGQGTTSITVDFGTTWGNVSVYSINGCGNSSPQDLFVTVGTPLAIGDFHEGGIIFWLDGAGGGLVCAIKDQDYGGDYTVYWGCMGHDVNGADGIVIGTGAQNTIDIWFDCIDLGTAAYICKYLTLNGNEPTTYEDWFLPSKDELNEMYLNREAINSTALSLTGGTSFHVGIEDLYWCSTEFSFNFAWVQSFQYGIQGAQDKFSGFGEHVRAVRAF